MVNAIFVGPWAWATLCVLYIQIDDFRSLPFLFFDCFVGHHNDFFYSKNREKLNTKMRFAYFFTLAAQPTILCEAQLPALIGRDKALLVKQHIHVQDVPILAPDMQDMLILNN